MKVIVTDISTSDVIIYDISNSKLNLISTEKDLLDSIEELLSDYHKLGNISWMQLEDDFKIEFKNI